MHGSSSVQMRWHIAGPTLGTAGFNAAVARWNSKRLPFMQSSPAGHAFCRVALRGTISAWTFRLPPVALLLSLHHSPDRQPTTLHNTILHCSHVHERLAFSRPIADVLRWGSITTAATSLHPQHLAFPRHGEHKHPVPRTAARACTIPHVCCHHEH